MSDAPPELPASLAGRYRAVRRLGEGGFGEVLLAEDRELGRRVAVKLLRDALDGEFAARFEREARVTSRLQHPNVVQVYDAGVDPEGGAWIAYEYVPGRDLAARLIEGPLGVEELRRLGADLADALGAAHEAGVLHRDVKPANVLLRADGGVPVLCDFGIARLVSGRTVQTATGTILGTPAYMAPELLGGAPPSPASDQFALAATLAEALTGELVYGSAEVAAVIRELGREGELPGVDRLRASGSPLGGVLRRALSRDPTRRYPDARALGAALRGEKDLSSVAPTRVLSAPPAAAPPPRRRPGFPALVGLAGLLTLGWWSASGPGPETDVPGAPPEDPRRAAAARELDRNVDAFRRLHPAPFEETPGGHPRHVQEVRERLLDTRVESAGKRLMESLLHWLEARGAAPLVPGTPDFNRLVLTAESFRHVVQDLKNLSSRAKEDLMGRTGSALDQLGRVQVRWQKIERIMQETLTRIQELPTAPPPRLLLFEEFLANNMDTPRVGETGRRIHAALARSGRTMDRVDLAFAQIHVLRGALVRKLEPHARCELLAEWLERSRDAFEGGLEEGGVDPYYLCWGPLYEIQLQAAMRGHCAATPPDATRLRRFLAAAREACRTPTARFELGRSSRYLSEFLATEPSVSREELRLREEIRDFLASPPAAGNVDVEWAARRVRDSLEGLRALHPDEFQYVPSRDRKLHVLEVEEALVQPQMGQLLSDLADGLALFVRTARRDGAQPRSTDPAWRAPLPEGIGALNHLAGDIQHLNSVLQRELIEGLRMGLKDRLRRSDRALERIDRRMAQLVDELATAPGPPGSRLLAHEARIAGLRARHRSARSVERLNQALEKGPGGEDLLVLMDALLYVLQVSSEDRNRGTFPCEELLQWLDGAERAFSRARGEEAARACNWSQHLLALRGRLVSRCGLPTPGQAARARAHLERLGQRCAPFRLDGYSPEEFRSALWGFLGALRNASREPELVRELEDLAASLPAN